MQRPASIRCVQSSCALLTVCSAPWLTPRTVSSDVCDLILHHARKGVTASHYDFSTLEGPMRKALQDWADYVCSIAGQGAAGGNIVPLKRA
jgi:hypothetical protein